MQAISKAYRLSIWITVPAFDSKAASDIGDRIARHLTEDPLILKADRGEVREMEENDNA